MDRVRRKHSDKLKKEAGVLSYQPDKSMAEIADDLSIHRSEPVRWCKGFEGLGVRAFPGNRFMKLTSVEEKT